MKDLNTDILYLIFNELKENKNSLHSCLLVNRKWCKLVVPILWKNHPWNDNDNGLDKKLLNTIISLLPPSSQQLLSENNIDLPSTEPPLFHYISCCKFPPVKVIEEIITMVIGDRNIDDNGRNLLEKEIYKLFVSQVDNTKELCWETTQPLSTFPGASTCFSQLRYLIIDINIVSSNALCKMAQICKHLNELSIHNCSQDLPGLISLIDAQKKLTCVNFFNPIKKGGEPCEELVKALARKADMIYELYLEVSTTILPSLLTSLVNLKGIVMNSAIKSELIKNEVKNYLSTWEFPLLQSICTVDLLCFKELAMLINKTRGDLSHVSVYTTDRNAKNTGILIEAIANNCPKMKVLFTYLVPDDFIHVKSLLINCRRLNAIYFDSLDYNSDDENIGDQLLNILSEFSPFSLNNLSISGSWNYSDEAFVNFFESFRKRNLCYFKIKGHVTKGHETIIRKYVKEGVIKMWDEGLG